MLNLGFQNALPKEEAPNTIFEKAVALAPLWFSSMGRQNRPRNGSGARRSLKAGLRQAEASGPVAVSRRRSIWADWLHPPALGGIFGPSLGPSSGA